jgi:phage recombination protein Bet
VHSSQQGGDYTPLLWVYVPERGEKKMEKRNNGNELAVTINHNEKNLEITESMVRSYLCPQASRGEIFMFLQLCQAQNLNPFIGEAYLIKYGSDVQMVVGKETFMKRAENNTAFQGFEAGIIVGKVSDKEFSVEHREGAFYIPSHEKLLGGWAEVKRKDREKPIKIEIPLQEYQKRNKEGRVIKQWAVMPATMIRKVALVQALREAFPNSLGGCYIAEEVTEGGREIIDAHYTTQNGSNNTEPAAGNGNGTSAEAHGNDITNENKDIVTYPLTDKSNGASASPDETSHHTSSSGDTTTNNGSEETTPLTEDESAHLLFELLESVRKLIGKGIDEVQAWWFNNKSSIDRLSKEHRDTLVVEVKKIKEGEKTHLKAA